MRPSQLLLTVSALFTRGFKRTVYIVGAPGGGKTEITAQAAAQIEGAGFMCIHAPLLQPEDYGMPVFSADKTKLSFIVSVDKFPLVGSPCPDRGIFLIDELPQADAAAQKILANLIQAREIHGHKIKPGWMIVATGNRVTDRSGASRLLSHLKNRVTEIELEISTEDWVNWALENNVAPEVINFIQMRPELLNSFDAQNEINATPRAWVEGVSAAIGAPNEFELYKGAVGEGAAATFTGYLRICRDLVHPDVIIMNPTGVPCPGPEKPEVLFAYCGALAHKTTVKNFGRIMDFVTRMPVEFQALYIKDALKLTKDAVTGTLEFIKWASGPGAKIYGAKSS